jgi:hypothetical protein
MKQAVCQELNIDTEALSDKYLGLPTAVGRSTAEAFEFMATRIKGLIGTWSGREASGAGREVLLKSVAQVVPTYSLTPCSFEHISRISRHPAVFFSHNKPVNSTFSHNNPAKRTGRELLPPVQDHLQKDEISNCKLLVG